AATTSDNDRTHLSFALAKAHEDLKDYAASFHYFKIANDLIKKRIGYSIDNERKVFEGTKKLFSPQIPSVSASESTVCPIFIVGMPRSGTTLTEQILASHSMVHGAGELTVMGEKLASLLEPKLNDPSMPGFSIEEVQGIREGYLKELEALGVSEQVIVDKMPTNFRSIGAIISAFPEAKIVHTNRDPMAVCWSNYKHFFVASMSGSARAIGFSSDLDDLAEYYKLYLDLMAFWRERFPGRIYDLDYESLTLNQEDETRRLLEFCELDWEDNCLDFHENRRAVRTASLSQVRKKIYTGSSEAWKKYEKYLEPLKNKLSRGSG
ncbi:sulfotransferase, partial [Gammaproteobacteria bacterium]|nr:sulfotransferase [Gammaproteobacteria bacterium]